MARSELVNKKRKKYHNLKFRTSFKIAPEFYASFNTITAKINQKYYENTMKIPTEKTMFPFTVDEAESTISTTVVGPYHQKPEDAEQDYRIRFNFYKMLCEFS